MKYRKEVQQHAASLPPSSIPCSTADSGIADEETLRLIRCHLAVATCLLTLGEVRGILSATTVNSLVNFWAMTGTDSLCSCLDHLRRHSGPTLMTLKLINLCMAWLLRVDLYENSRCRGVLKHHLWWWESKRDCNAWKLSFTSKGIEGVQVMVVRAAYM